MNVIGIDYQQTISVLALREGRGDSAVATSIGDGRRVVIPHAVLPTGVWGSDALQNAPATCYQPLDPLRDGPWLDSPAAGLFWQAIYVRLFGYLGRMKPTLANGYGMAIALQGGDWNAARKGVQTLCAQAGADKNDLAGLREAVCIPATEALLCRWLTSPADFAPTRNTDTDLGGGDTRRKESGVLPEEAVIAVVAVGDSSTLVGAYRVQCDHAGQWRITARPNALQHLATGLSAWQARLLTEVCSRFREERGPDNTLDLRDSALDFAWKITQTAANQELTWRGSGQEHMYAPLCLTRAECARWPEAHLLQTSLPQALTRAVAALGKVKRSDRILVGGVGALWPFAGEIANRVAPVWSSSSPQTDIAVGAASWREVAGDVLQLSVSEPRIEAVTAASPARRSEQQSTPVNLQAQAPPSPVSAPPAGKRSEKAVVAPPPQTLLSPQGRPPPADKKRDADDVPSVPPHPAVDGDAWNAPEPGIVPPWERE